MSNFFLTTGVQARFCKGNAEAQGHLGFDYAHGQGEPKDYVKAADWFMKSAAQGYAEAQYNLGSLYAHGQGVPKDYAKAIYWLKKAAEQGNKTAKRDLQRAEREDRAQQRRRPRP